MNSPFATDSSKSLTTRIGYILTLFIVGGLTLGCVGALLQMEGVAPGQIIQILILFIIPTHFTVYGIYRWVSAGSIRHKASGAESLEPTFLRSFASRPAFLSRNIRVATVGFLSALLIAVVTQRLSDANRILAEQEALAKSDHPDLLGQVELRKGTTYFLAGEVAKAEAAYKRTLWSARQQKDSSLEASALSGLGSVAMKNEHYDEAIDLNSAALQLSVGPKGSSARVLGSMAWSYRKLGDLKNALAFYKQAEEASERGESVEERLYWLTCISNVYYEQHDYGSAEAALTQALHLVRSVGNRSKLTENLIRLSEVALETGRISQADKYFQEDSYLKPAVSESSDVVDLMLVQGRISQGKHDYGKARRAFQRVIQDPDAESWQKWEAEARLAKVYAEEGLAAKAENEFRRSLRTVEAGRTPVQAEEFRLSFSAGSFYSDYIEFLISRRRVAEALRVAELSRAQTFAGGFVPVQKVSSMMPRNVRPEQFAQQLSATLLFYWIGQKESYLWVITPTRTTHFVLPRESEIDAVVKSYREALLESRDVLETSNPDGKKLYSMLVGPAKKLIAPGSRVIVLPDASLYGLNFETLIVPEPKPHYWIEDVTLTAANSLTFLGSSATRPQPKEKSLLLIGNTEQPNPAFPSFAQARAEMKQVEQYFPEAQRQILEGKQATPAAYLRSNPERFSYLHFVTHGIASRPRPLESAVILSREPDSDSYKLYARDIVKHHLNTQLVTISACNGAGTGAYSGDGLVGLSWAFLRAGAHNVIGPLWEVSDLSTPELMNKMYAGLSAGNDPATALRDAKLSLLRSDTVFRKPFYWAPFQLYAGSNNRSAVRPTGKV